MKNRSGEESQYKKRLKAERYAYLLLKFRPRSTKEVQDRLLRKGFEKELVRDVIESLTEKRLLSDKEFSRWWVKNRIIASPRGKKLLRLELKIKGIADDEIDDVLKEVSPGEESDEFLAKEVALKKLKRATIFSDDKVKVKRRLFAFLKRRGFSNDTVMRTIRELLDEK